MRRFSILAALALGLALTTTSAMAQTTFVVPSPVVPATTLATPVYYPRPYGAYYRPYGAYYRPYVAPYYRPYVAPYAPYVAPYRPYVAPYRAYYPGYYYAPRPFVGFGVY